MSIKNKIAQYKEWKSGVKHCTFDPDGPGVVRMHLIPPRFKLFGNPEYLLILNGYYILPLGYSWALMLSAFMDEVNKFDGVEISGDDEATIISVTIKRMKKIYPMVSKEEIEDDLYLMLDVVFEVARGGTPDVDIEKLSIRKYSENMTQFLEEE